MNSNQPSGQSEASRPSTVVVTPVLLCVVGVPVAGFALAIARLSPRCEWTAASVQASQQTGDGIVRGLVKFRAERTRYPDALTELVDEGYLDTIANPSAGSGKWLYTSDGSGFILSFGCGPDAYPESYVTDEDPVNWHVDQ